MSKIRVLVVATGALLWSVVSAAQTLIPTPPTVAARAHLLQDYWTGQLLVESNIDERLEPASLTKIMTAYVGFSELKEGNIKLDDEVRVSEEAWRMPGSRMFVEVGTRVKVSDLLKGIIVQSGNDASVALAEHIAGSEESFAALMNQYAKKLGLDNTNFTNSQGLPDPKHYTTARDVSELTRALIRDFPNGYKWHAVKEYVYNGIKQHNRNRLLWRDSSVDGVKTGYTKGAGYCLAASAQRGDMRLVSVVLGANSVKARLRDSQALLTYGFRFYETERVVSVGEAVAEARVWGGATDTLGFGVAEDLYVTVPRGKSRNLKREFVFDGHVLAPVTAGERKGRLRITLGDKSLAERALVALGSVEEGSLWQQMADKVMILFE
ncbi:MAG: D-alanyl-D-alanine carboxypeptidase family protein [Pseudomonadota bacterium]